MAVTYVPANIVKDMAGAFWPLAHWRARSRESAHLSVCIDDDGRKS
jgi:hypothetical protein